MNDYFYKLAQVSAAIAGDPIKPEYIYCQWEHETGGFQSELCLNYHNLGGLCQLQPNDTPQPDGNQYYMQFPSYEAYADYFGHYLRWYREDGLYEATDLQGYVTALKHGGYFGDSLENYLANVERIYKESGFNG